MRTCCKRLASERWRNAGGDLVRPDRRDRGLSQWELDLWMLVGVAVLLIGDRIVERRFGTSGTGGAMGIVVGSVVGGVPKSAIFGIQLATGLPVSGQLPHCCHRRQCAAGDRPIRRSRRRRMEGAATRSAVAPRGAGVRCRGSTGLPGRGSRKRYRRIPDPDSGPAAGGLLAMLRIHCCRSPTKRGGELTGAATVVGVYLSLSGT